MSESPVISIVVPVWNSERFLAQTIESVQNQTLSHWELVILDDGSTDNSAGIAQKYAVGDARIRALSQANGGVVAARNAGYQAANPAAPFVIFLDHDDYWEPDALQLLKAALDAHPAAPAAYGMSKQVDARGNPWITRIEDAFGYERFGIRDGRKTKIGEDALTTFDALAIWPCFQTPGQILVRRTALERASESAGPFDAQAQGSDEWELAMRLSLEGGLVRVLKFVINKREHDRNAYNLPGYFKNNQIRQKLARSPVYETQRALAQQAHRLSAQTQWNWAGESARRFRWKMAAGQMARAWKEYRLCRSLFR